MARTVLTYPRNPIGGVFIPGAKSIEGATGDTARTTTGWIEDEKYRHYVYEVVNGLSCEFDTAVTRTGTKTTLLATNGSGRGVVYVGFGHTDGSSTAVYNQATIERYAFPLKASTEYIFNCWCKTDNVATNAVKVSIDEIKSDFTGVQVTNTTNTLSGTNDWTLLTVPFTTNAATIWGNVTLYNNVVGNISDAWFDVNSMTLVETGVARTAPTYPRNPIGAVYIKGAKSIEGATGDIARTTAGWIENQKYNWYCYVQTTAISAEFDTAVTRTGTKTLKLSTTDETGRIIAISGSLVSVANLPFASTIKPSTEYILSCYVKTNNVATNGVFITMWESNDTGAEITSASTNKLSGTNDWTLLTVTWTTNASSNKVFPHLRNNVVGNISDAWFDVNSMTLTEVDKVRTVVA